MNDFRKNFGKKTIGEKKFVNRDDYETLLKVMFDNKKPLVSIIKELIYETNGEEFILVKEVDESKIILNHNTTNHIKIKSLTKTLVVTKESKIDEYYDEILLDKGACVEFVFIEGSWYIISSDGLKQS